jgi:hypothetical protein
MLYINSKSQALIYVQLSCSISSDDALIVAAVCAYRTGSSANGPSINDSVSVIPTLRSIGLVSILGCSCGCWRGRDFKTSLLVGEHLSSDLASSILLCSSASRSYSVPTPTPTCASIGSCTDPENGSSL